MNGIPRRNPRLQSGLGAPLALNVLLFSDIHGDLRALELLVTEEADLYIAAGDLSTFGREPQGCGEAL
jgi:hypothetical protein